jgi:hypothetical protein
MKTIMMAVAMLAAIAMPAHAQMSKHGRGAVSTQAEPPKPIDEKAYKAALERIPDSKQKYDPWGVARPPDPAKKPK